MKKIRILHIAQSNGGVAEYLKMLIKYIDKYKFDIYLLASREYESERENFEKLGCKLTTIEMKREISLRYDIKSVVNIRHYIKEIKPNIIHLHSSKAGALGRIAAMFFKIPIVYNAHGWAFDMDVGKKKKLMYAYIEKILAKFTDVIVDVSDFEKNAQVKHRIVPKVETKVINNGIDIEMYEVEYNSDIERKKLNIPIEAFVVGIVARISEAKSPESFIRIAKQLNSIVSNCYFIWVGDGELRDELQSSVDKCGLNDNFLITDWTNQVPKYISIFDVGVLTSRWEGFGLALAEYMACKKPVVAFKSGGISDVVQNNYNGLLFDFGDISGFCTGIIEIKNNTKLKKTLVNNGYESVNKRFNVKRVAVEHEKLYLSLL